MLALVHAQNGPTERGRGGGEEGRGESGKQGMLQQGSKQIIFTIPAMENIEMFHNNILQISFYSHVLFLTCPEGGSLPVMVVVGEAGEARHAAGVVVLEPLEEFA